MLIGNPSIFAIESHLQKAFCEVSLRGLGFFVIYISSHRYGDYNPDATMLACSFDTVQRRLSQRGEHHAHILSRQSAVQVADAVYAASFVEDRQDDLFFGMSASNFRDLVAERELLWAPDGDRAFDDGSYVLQIDEGEEVRLIGFRVNDNQKNYLVDLSELWIDSFHFYKVLDEWQRKFQAEWADSIKTYE